jgi:hypothetical protein
MRDGALGELALEIGNDLVAFSGGEEQADEGERE